MRLFGQLAATCLLAFLGLPLAALFLVLPWTELETHLVNPAFGDALRLSLLTSAVSTAVIGLVGTPAAYWLTRSHSRLARLGGVVGELPMVLPPAVAGVALLMTFGRYGLLGRYLDTGLSFSTAAVVLVQVFVGAPFFLRAARDSFEAVPETLEQTSLTLGVQPAATFMRVTLPLSLPGLLGGLIMAWARAVGEFGATIMFAGNMRGVSRTLPLAIYTALETDYAAAMVMSALMVVISIAVLVLARRLAAEGKVAVPVNGGGGRGEC